MKRALLLALFSASVIYAQPRFIAGSINGLPSSGVPNIPAGQDNTIVVQVQDTGNGLYDVGLTISESWYPNYGCSINTIIPNYPNLSTAYLTLVTDNNDPEPAMSFGASLSRRNSACTLTATQSSLIPVGNNIYQITVHVTFNEPYEGADTFT